MIQTGNAVVMLLGKNTSRAENWYEPAPDQWLPGLRVKARFQASLSMRTAIHLGELVPTNIILTFWGFSDVDVPSCPCHPRSLAWWNKGREGDGTRSTIKLRRTASRRSPSQATKFNWSSILIWKYNLCGYFEAKMILMLPNFFLKRPSFWLCLKKCVKAMAFAETSICQGIYLVLIDIRRTGTS